MDFQEIALSALADQVQTICQESDYEVVTVILIAKDGGVEVRSQLSEETTREALQIIAEEF